MGRSECVYFQENHFGCQHMNTVSPIKCYLSILCASEKIIRAIQLISLSKQLSSHLHSCFGEISAGALLEVLEECGQHLERLQRVDVVFLG
ncbi:hypothetical protein Y032_0103g3558 [Ancylostoma ceylanicum]|uniref:Uncharacterized protein n=1 Tax=Ancylostoma ceylanicum TaxID=53326 RepID=A0A016TH21_9BILA|nr:hypothetical protein Y032_0103g3558 [Ancylostoma ceylanicum]